MPSLSDWITGLPVSSPGASVYSGVVIQDGVAKQTPAIQLGAIPRLYVPSSRNLTLADTRGGILTSSSAGTVAMTLPTFWELDFTRDADNPVELVLLIQRGGVGSLVVTPSLYHGSVANEAAMLALNPTSIGDWCVRTDDSSHVYVHTSGDGNSAGHWTEITDAPANAPTAAGILVEWNDLDPQYREKDHPPVMLVTNGNDSWVAM
jgi:hypothetical protein